LTIDFDLWELWGPLEGIDRYVGPDDISAAAVLAVGGHRSGHDLPAGSVADGLCEKFNL
jgi:hypothetical protein